MGIMCYGCSFYSKNHGCIVNKCHRADDNGPAYEKNTGRWLKRGDHFICSVCGAESKRQKSICPGCAFSMEKCKESTLNCRETADFLLVVSDMCSRAEGCEVCPMSLSTDGAKRCVFDLLDNPEELTKRVSFEELIVKAQDYADNDMQDS